MWAVGRHPVGIALEDDPAVVEDHEAVGIRLVEELADAQLPEVDRSGRKLPRLRGIVRDVGRRDELAHVVERPAVEGRRPPVLERHLPVARRRKSVHEPGHRSGRSFRCQSRMGPPSPATTPLRPRISSYARSTARMGWGTREGYGWQAIAMIFGRSALSSYRHSNWSIAREYRASDGWCWTAIRTMSWISKLYGNATMGRDVVRSVTG